MRVVLSPKGWLRPMSTLGVDIYPGDGDVAALGKKQHSAWDSA